MDLGKDTEAKTGEDFSFVEGTTSDTPEDILKRHGPKMTMEVSCSWALYGWPAESQLLFERGLNTWAGYTEKLRDRIKSLIEQLLNRQEAIERYNTKNDTSNINNDQ